MSSDNSDSKTVENSVSEMSAADKLDKLKTFLDNACAPFKTWSYNKVMENDHQYDIDSLIEQFNKLYEQMYGKAPDSGLIRSEIAKRCKPYKPCRNYGVDCDEDCDDCDNNY